MLEGDLLLLHMRLHIVRLLPKALSPAPSAFTCWSKTCFFVIPYLVFFWNVEYGVGLLYCGGANSFALLYLRYSSYKFFRGKDFEIWVYGSLKP